MSKVTIARGWLFGAAAALALTAGGVGFTLAGMQGSEDSGAAKPAARKILYWYDPMILAEHHDGPGLSSMGMQTIPRYADESGASAQAPGISVDASASQALGLRIATVRRGELASSLTATGTIDFNQRDVAIVQARAAGFVQRVYSRAPGDVVGAGAPLADLLVPEWGGAQAEFLAVRRTGNTALTQAARQRLMLLGMPSGAIASVERTGRPHNVVTISTPTGGVIKTLDVRAGMTMTAGQTLAEVNGLGTVWLNAAVPEAIAGPLKPGQSVQATLAAFPGVTLSGRVSAILPQTQADSRTLTVRIELPNRGGRLRPGMFATVSFGGSSNNSRVVEVDPQDHVVWTYVTTTPRGGNPSPLPSRAVRLSNGETLISDQFNHRVLAVDPNGRIVRQYGARNLAGYDADDARRGLNAPYDAKRIGDYTGMTWSDSLHTVPQR